MTWAPRSRYVHTADDPEIHIAVVEGSVALAGAELHAQDVASIDQTGRMLVTHAGGSATYTSHGDKASWCLTIQRSAMSCSELNRMYDVADHHQ